jgi:hypothetical protein
MNYYFYVASYKNGCWESDTSRLMSLKCSNLTEKSELWKFKLPDISGCYEETQEVCSAPSVLQEFKKLPNISDIRCYVHGPTNNGGNMKRVQNIDCLHGNPVMLLHVSLAVNRSVLVTLAWCGFNYCHGCRGGTFCSVRHTVMEQLAWVICFQFCLFYSP